MMKRTLSTILGVMVAASTACSSGAAHVASAPQLPPEPVASATSYRDEVAAAGAIRTGTDAKGREYAYWIRTPEAASHGEAAPAIFFFHCRGWGDPVTKNHLLEREFELFRDEALRRGYAIVAVSYGENSWMNAEGQARALAAVDHACATDGLDRTRLYAMGISMGGCGSMILSANNPGLFRGLGNLAGVSDYEHFYRSGKYNQKLREALGGSPDDVPEVYRSLSVVNYPEKFRSVPVFIIHGTADTVVSNEYSVRLAEKLRGAGVRVIHREAQDVAHDAKVIQGYETQVLNFFDSLQTK